MKSARFEQIKLLIGFVSQTGSSNEIFSSLKSSGTTRLWSLASLKWLGRGQRAWRLLKTWQKTEERRFQLHGNVRSARLSWLTWVATWVLLLRSFIKRIWKVLTSFEFSSAHYEGETGLKDETLPQRRSETSVRLVHTLVQVRRSSQCINQRVQGRIDR